MEFYNNILNTHGNNNLLNGYSDFDMSKYPIYTAQGEENFINDIYENLNENFIDDNEVDVDNEFDNIKEEEINENINAKNIKDYVEKNENKNIEEFTTLKDLLNKERKERQTEKSLLFVIIIGICIILLFHSKKTK